MANEIYLARLDLSQIYPPFLQLARNLVDSFVAKGDSYYATSGFRSVEDQDALFAYGRTDMTKGKVTNARGGFSAHNYGLAFDFCHDGDLSKAGLQPDWQDAKYTNLANQAKAVGLDSGYFWKSIHDAPHVQLNLSKYGIGWSDLLGIYEDHGLAGVWKHLDGFQW